MADLSSILGGMVQGFKDFGTGLVDFFGTGAANIGDIASSIATGRATTKNQDDFRKWLYQTDDKQDAAAKGLGTILNGVSTVADVMPGAQAVTANPLFNGLQGAIGGVSDELKMAGKDADWGRAAQRAGVGAASGLASGYAGQGLAKTGNKLLSNGLTRGAVSGALGGGIANAGYTGIEGGSVQDMINAGLYGAQTGALVGGTTGLARELIKPTHKMDAMGAAERQARIENAQAQIDDIGPISIFATDEDSIAKRARIAELNDTIKAYQAGFDTVDDYNAASAKPVYDSAGEEIPRPMVDYYKDVSPAVRDENGRLIRFYHGTPSATFETFADGSYFTPNKWYADFYQEPQASSLSYGKTAQKPGTYEVYLDIKKPFDISDPDARRIYIDEYVKGGNATGINPYQSNYDDIKNIDWTEAEGLRDFLRENNYGYDAIISDEGGFFDENGNVVSRGKSYMPFSGDQVITLKTNYKETAPKKPTNVAELMESNVGKIKIGGEGGYSSDFANRYGEQIKAAGADKSPEAMAKLLNKRGNKDMVRSAFMTQQDDAPGSDMWKVYNEYGGAKADGRKTVADLMLNDDAKPSLVTYHGVSTEKLKKAINNLGGDIVNPSLQAVNPDINPGTDYGEVILLGNKDMYFNKGSFGLIDSTGKTNAYTRDVYSPRVPEYEEKGGKKYIKGTRKEYTSKNISDYMNKKGVQSTESNWATPGSVAAAQARRFNNLSDILDNAGAIGDKTANRKAFSDFEDFLYDKVRDYAEKTGKFGDNKFMSIDNITEELQDALKGKYQADDFYGLKTPEGQQLIKEVRQEISKLPTDYFELKMNRPVELKEFSGAILPEGYDDAEVLQALKDAGVEVLANYDRKNNAEASLQAALKSATKGKNRFTTPYMLGVAGLLGTGGIAAAATPKDDKKKKSEVK